MSNRPKAASHIEGQFERPPVSFMQPDSSSKHGTANTSSAATPPLPTPDPEPLRSVEDDFILRILEGRTDFTGPYSRPRQPKYDAEFPRNIAPVLGLSQAYSFFPEIDLLSPKLDFVPAGQLLYSSLLPGHLVSSNHRKLFSFQSTPVRSQSSLAQLADHPNGYSKMTASSDPASTHIHTENSQIRSTTPEELRQEIQQHLFDIRQERHSPERTWATFLTLLRMNDREASKGLRKLSSTLFAKTTKAWCEGNAGGLLLPPSAVLQRFTKLDIKVHWNDLEVLWEMLLRTALDQIRGVPTLHAPPSLLELSTELLNTWDWWLQRPGDNTSVTISENASLTWQTIVASEQMLNISSWSSNAVRARFDYIFPTANAESRGKTNKYGLLIGTYGVLQIAIERNVLGPARERALPLLTFVNLLCTNANMRPFLVQSYWRPIVGVENKVRLGRTLKQYLARQVPLIAIPIGSSIDPTPGQSEPVSDTRFGVMRGLAAAHLTADAQILFDRRIKRAGAVKDYRRLEQLWKEVLDWSERDKSFLNEGIYEQILRGFMLSHHPQRAIETWNHMLTAGIKPDINIYQSMIYCFSQIFDESGIDAMWSMMIEAGIQPVHGTWVTRIRAYTHARLWKKAIRCFDEMLGQWLDACRAHNKNIKSGDLPALGDFEQALKPTTKMMNAALLALNTAHQQQEVTRLLKNCKTIGVPFNQHTYNSLLLAALKEGADGEVDALFTRMQREGIEPDVATFTMLINSIFRGDAIESTLDERKEAARSLLNAVQAQGLEANSWTFTSIINGLLKMDHLEKRNTAEPNIEAAYEILAYMQQKEIPLTLQIYTALVTAHFAEQPKPNISAVDAIWDKARLDQTVILDQVFYDRLIEGFARFGQIPKMKLALAQSSRNGQIAGWVALAQMLKALAQVGDWTSAEDVVHNMRLEEETGVVRKRIGKAYFIETAKEYALDVQSLIKEDDWDSDTTRFKYQSERNWNAV